MGKIGGFCVYILQMVQAITPNRLLLGYRRLSENCGECSDTPWSGNLQCVRDYNLYNWVSLYFCYARHYDKRGCVEAVFVAGKEKRIRTLVIVWLIWKGRGHDETLYMVGCACPIVYTVASAFCINILSSDHENSV